MDQEPLPRRLRLARAERGLTLRQAAKVTGVSRETLNELEHGRREPHPPTVYKIAQGYGVPVHVLLGEEPLPVPKADAPGALHFIYEGEEERRRSYARSWSTYLDELASDIEEWKLETYGSGDPADLPEGEFLFFIRSVVPLTRAYLRAHDAVCKDNGLLALLRAEPLSTDQRWAEEVDRVERAYRRISRVMLALAAGRVRQRTEELARAAAAEEEEGAPPAAVSVSMGRRLLDNVAELFGGVRATA